MSLGEKVKLGKHIWVDLEKVFLQLIGTSICQCVFFSESRQAFFKLFVVHKINVPGLKYYSPGSGCSKDGQTLIRD